MLCLIANCVAVDFLIYCCLTTLPVTQNTQRLSVESVKKSVTETKLWPNPQYYPYTQVELSKNTKKSQYRQSSGQTIKQRTHPTLFDLMVIQ